eukprot:7053938-Prymnesium_polylepis.4
MSLVTELLGGIAASPQPTDKLCQKLTGLGYFNLKPGAYKRISLDFKKYDTNYIFDLAERNEKKTRDFQAKSVMILDQPEHRCLAKRQIKETVTQLLVDKI